MTEDIQPEVLKRTQESLGKFIKKPILSEKLLRKPPFRFLHDICTAAMKETGFFEDILSGNDVKIELINDKEGKIAFLQKVIGAVESANNVKLTVKPNKIVAGHEPIKTNEFLQALAYALEKQVQMKSPKKTLRKSKIVKPEVKTDDAVKKKNKVNKTTDVRRKKPVEKKVEKETPVEAELPKDNGENLTNGDNVGEESVKLEPAPRPASAKLKKRTPSAQEKILDQVLGDVVRDEQVPEKEPKPEPEPQPEPTPPKIDEQKIDNVDAVIAPPRPRTAIRPPSARPASARPAAPRIRDRGQVPVQEETIQPAAGKVNVIVEQELQQDDEELVSVQTAPDTDLNESVEIFNNNAEHGQLVNKILEAQKELEEDAFTKKSTPARTEIEWSTGRGIEGTRKEVERLRAAVQTLTRSANPLGKLLEYLQEDVDSMQLELNSWRERNSTLNLKLEHERSLTDKSIEPLKSHLEELELSIQQELTQIGAVKANVLRNDERLNRLFLGI